MTGNIFVDCIFLFLICYGLICGFHHLSEFLLHKYCRYPQSTFLVAQINHQSQTFECDIRCAVSKSIKNKCALVFICNDLDLSEYTLLWRITDCYNHIIITDSNEFSAKIEMAKSISVSQ